MSSQTPGPFTRAGDGGGCASAGDAVASTAVAAARSTSRRVMSENISSSVGARREERDREPARDDRGEGHADGEEHPAPVLPRRAKSRDLDEDFAERHGAAAVRPGEHEVCEDDQGED